MINTLSAIVLAACVAATLNLLPGFAPTVDMVLGIDKKTSRTLRDIASSNGVDDLALAAEE